MGAGASITRSPSSLQAEIGRLRERELNAKEENVKDWDKVEVRVTGNIAKLTSERNELAQKLADVEASLAKHKDGWSREKAKTMALTYSSLPLSLLSKEEMAHLERKSNFSITKNFSMVTIAQSDIVGFSSLAVRLKPHEIIKIIDHLQAILDDVYSSKDIFIVERDSDGCCAVSGLTNALLDDKKLHVSDDLSLADSSYGSENNLFDHSDKRTVDSAVASDLKRASFYASQLATAALRLLSASSKIIIPIAEHKQLQIRIALHSGPCLAGVVGLQTAWGVNRIPQFKILGPTQRRAKNLCSTGLALQIRVSRQCRDLLLSEKQGFQFERCPDYTAWADRKPIESYWLVGKSDLDLKMPSLDLALPLSEYEDTEV